MMIVKITILLYAGCAVALARPQDLAGLNGLSQIQNQIRPQQQLNAGLDELQQYQQQFQNFLQGLTPNQLQHYQNWISQLQRFNPNQLQNVNIPSGYNNGYNGNYNSNPKYQAPLLDVPNQAIDWGQNVVDGSVSRLGSALGQTYGNTQRLANNVVDTVSEVGRRGLQDGSSLVKSGINLFSEIPRIGFDLLSRNNRNNNGFGF